jgi:Co/Zn/Cd efflux system component
MPGRRTGSNPIQQARPQSDNIYAAAENTDPLVQCDEVISKARIRFLAVALCNTVAPALVGLIVYHVTHSLTIEVDFASASCDALSLLLNIIVEYMKNKAASNRLVLVLDFGGGFISMALLVGVAVFGVLNATNKVINPVDESERVEHVGLMLFYNSFSVALDIFTLVYWWQSRSLLMPPGSRSDQLNVNSGLLHSIVDFMRGIAVTGTSFWMIYINFKAETPWNELKDKVHGDVFGSFLLCACVLFSAAFLLKESIDTLRKICDSTKVEQNIPVARPVTAPDAIRGNYGSIKAAV